jgi:hypothetical protein
MTNISDIRRENLRSLKAKEGAQSLAKRLSRPSSFISQLAGPNPSRVISESNAREFEELLGLEPGSLDRDPAAGQPKPAAVPIASAQLVAEVMRAVGAACDEEQVKPPMAKLTEVMAMVFTDAVEHGGQAREEYIRPLVRLLK